MSDTSPLDELERNVLAARVNRETREQKLERAPRWRFRRRKRLQRSLRRHRAWEKELQQSLDGRSARS